MVARHTMGSAGSPSIDALMHVPTLLAVVVVFRRRLGAIVISLGRPIGGRAEDEDRMHLRLI